MSNSAAAGGSSVMDVLDRVIGLPGNSSGSAASNNNTGVAAAKLFIPSKKFSGSKPGYVFRSSDLGTGYYLDEEPQQQQQPRQQQQQQSGDNGDRRESKRPRFKEEEDPNDQQQQKQRSVVRFDASRDTTQLIPPNNNNNNKQRPLTGSELLAQAEHHQSSTHYSTPKTIHDLSSRGIQSSSSSFAKTLTKNQFLRAQYSPHQPEKFMMNELALHDEIQQFDGVAVQLNWDAPI